MKVEEVTAKHKEFMGYLASDPLRNTFALYDLTEEGERVRCYAASREGAFRGYILLWHGAEYPSVILHGSQEAAHELLPRAPMESCTFLVNPPLRSCVEETRRITAHHVMDVMAVDRDGARLPDVKKARRLQPWDAAGLAALYNEIGQGGRDYETWISRGIAYGIFESNRLVSVAGTHVLSKDLCLVGGVYTSRDARMRGYAAEVTVAVTRHALRQVPTVSLLVVSINKVAIRLYEKLGYRKVMEWVWMDVGTGRRPLM
ncbi:MAG: GNAT family N-acetyltransferase [Thermoplasmata archaeon]